MLLGLLLSVLGCLSIALGIDRHWRDIMGSSRPHGRHERALVRSFGAALLCGSLALCLEGQPASLGVLLWAVETMAGAGGAGAVLALTAFQRRRHGPPY